MQSLAMTTPAKLLRKGKFPEKKEPLISYNHKQTADLHNSNRAGRLGVSVSSGAPLIFINTLSKRLGVVLSLFLYLQFGLVLTSPTVPSLSLSPPGRATRKRSGRPSSVNQLRDGVLTIRLIFRVWKYLRRVKDTKKEETLK
jgi:hypothetical protein